jgi:DNA-binding CsgD family transcriptional regulator
MNYTLDGTHTSQLVDKSLVVAGDKGGVWRYRMLDPIRQYAREQLEESEEAQRVRQRHASYYLALSERAEPELTGARQGPWLGRLEMELDNLRAALSWALYAEEAPEEQRGETGLRLAAALGRFWNAHGPAEGRRWLEKGLAMGGGPAAPVRAKALCEAGFIAAYQNDPRALPMLEEAFALYKGMGDKRGMAVSVSNLGHAVSHLGGRQRMVSLREEAEALLRESLEKRVKAHLLLFLGLAAEEERDFDQVRARLEEALSLFRELGDTRNAAMCLTIMGMGALEQGDTDRAEALWREDLQLLRAARDKMGIFFGLLGMAGVATLQGLPTRTAKLMGASETLREEIGVSLKTLISSRYNYEGRLAALREDLDGVTFDAAWSQGQAMSTEQALEYALSEEEPPPPPEPRRAPDYLTRREREVATLAAQGFTNHRIAAELSISEYTVANHLRSILKKLGLRSRAQIPSRL